MKHILSLAAAAFVTFGLTAGEAPKQAPDTVKGFAFTDIKVIPTTPVKDQNSSGTCWCFASTSFLEDEIKHKGGKELDLSEMFTVRQCYLDKADKYIRTGGNINFAQGGACHDVAYVWEKYGAVPESAYPGLNYGEEKHYHYEMAAALKSYLDAILKNPNRRLSTAWKKGFEGILDAYLGEFPETFEYEGKTYTPRSFADAQGLDMNDYVSITSFTHHPFYTTFPIEVADNWLWGDSYNVPMEEMKAIVDNALENGYSISWAADVSEPSFRWADGFAMMPKTKKVEDMTNAEVAKWSKMSDKERRNKQNEINGPMEEITVTQESRQEMFDRMETTDDHGMEIIGYAKDQNGNRWYKVKNSWDDNQVYGGFFYVSEPYLLAKTLNIYVNKNAVPKEIAKKIKL